MLGAHSSLPNCTAHNQARSARLPVPTPGDPLSVTFFSEDYIMVAGTEKWAPFANFI